MSLIVRIDVDRPFGKEPRLRHMLSGLASRFYFPRIEAFGFLRELAEILEMMNASRASAYVFFRRCTLPSQRIMDLLNAGGHQIGLHLENSRSLETCADEKSLLESHVGRPVFAMSKHGSGKEKYGLHHFAPYEPTKYIDWSRELGLKLFLGNLEDPRMLPETADNVVVYPAAFWLEPAWRDTQKFTIDWLAAESRTRDIVLLLHPENVLASAALTADFQRLISSLETRIVI